MKKNLHGYWKYATIYYSSSRSTFFFIRGECGSHCSWFKRHSTFHCTSFQTGRMSSDNTEPPGCFKVKMTSLNQTQTPHEPADKVDPNLYYKRVWKLRSGPSCRGNWVSTCNEFHWKGYNRATPIRGAGEKNSIPSNLLHEMMERTQISKGKIWYQELRLWSLQSCVSTTNNRWKSSKIIRIFIRTSPHVQLNSMSPSIPSVVAI